MNKKHPTDEIINYILRAGHRFLLQLPPELAHDIALKLVKLGKTLGLLPGQTPGKQVVWKDLVFPNPVGLAAGLDKNGDAIDALAACGFGFVEIGTVTPKPQPGNPKPRLFRLARHQALINRMGFNNKGVDYAVERLKHASPGIIKGVNIGKNAATSIEDAYLDYTHCLEKVYPWCNYIVVNISSPNTKNLRQLQQDKESRKLFSEIAKKRQQLGNKHSCYKPILVKISPDMDSSTLDDLINQSLEYKMDGIIATNTSISRPRQLNTEKLAGENGGLSGKPIHDISRQTLINVRKALPEDKMLIAVGGISDANSATEAMELGARLVQVYSAFIYSGVGLPESLVFALNQENNNA